MSVNRLTREPQRVLVDASQPFLQSYQKRAVELRCMCEEASIGSTIEKLERELAAGSSIEKLEPAAAEPAREEDSDRARVLDA
eukprot:5292897-Amphidinium_carterae.1